MAIEYSLVKHRDHDRIEATAAAADAKADPLPPPKQAPDGDAPALGVTGSKLSACVYMLVQETRMDILVDAISLLARYYLRRYPYDLVLFEEDFSAKGKAHVEAVFHHAMRTQQKNEGGVGDTGAATGARLVWKRVVFDLPDWIDASAKNDNLVCNQRSGSIGYRHMCRFHSLPAHEYLAEMGYDWHWRLDDDSYLTSEVGYDVFRLMVQNKKRYGYVSMVQEFEWCVDGLWEAAERFNRGDFDGEEVSGRHNVSGGVGGAAGVRPGEDLAQHLRRLSGVSEPVMDAVGEGSARTLASGPSGAKKSNSSQQSDWIHLLEDKSIFYTNFEISHRSIWQSRAYQVSKAQHRTPTTTTTKYPKNDPTGSVGHHPCQPSPRQPYRAPPTNPTNPPSS